MIDLKALLDKNKFSRIKKYLFKRGVREEELFQIKEKLEKKLELINKLNKLRNQRKISSKKNSSEEIKKNVKKTKEEITDHNQKLKGITEELFLLASRLPNIPKNNTPENQKGNKEIKKIYFSHSILHNLPHQKVIQRLNLIDEEKSTILSGNKFVVYQKEGSTLLHGLIIFLLNKNKKKGYRVFDAPYIVDKKNLFNTGQLPKFEKDLYLIKNSNLSLIPTSEVSLVNLYQQEIIREKDLPIKLSSYSPCFRAESGASGQKSKGLIRLHQFHKVEIIQIVHPNKSNKALREMVKTASGILKTLKISHRIVDLCYEELGVAAAKTLDIEVWLPVTKKWLEISSCSNCTDFQTRRANIKILEENRKKIFAHSLNASSLAIDRLILTLCEYYYEEKENRLLLPKSLNKYLKLLN